MVGSTKISNGGPWPSVTKSNSHTLTIKHQEATEDDIEDEDDDSMDIDTGSGARKVCNRIPESFDLERERANRVIKINSIADDCKK